MSFSRNLWLRPHHRLAQIRMCHEFCLFTCYLFECSSLQTHIRKLGKVPSGAIGHRMVSNELYLRTAEPLQSWSATLGCLSPCTPEVSEVSGFAVATGHRGICLTVTAGETLWRLRPGGLSLAHNNSEGWWYNWDQDLEFWNFPKSRGP